jgi:hypothetical protein
MIYQNRSARLFAKWQLQAHDLGRLNNSLDGCPDYPAAPQLAANKFPIYQE